MKSNLMENLVSTPICIGTGLVALDVVISSNPDIPAQFLAGGSCGNVITILSYLGWDTYPIARLSNNVASELLLQDLTKWSVNDDLLSFTNDGSTPIIIHRILKDKNGEPKHRFEFKNPEDGSYLPSYKPCLAKSVTDIVNKSNVPNVFFFDRVNRASIELAKLYKSLGTIVVFEPSSIKDLKGFKECLDIADILKYSDERIKEHEQIFPVGYVPLEIQTLGVEGLKFRRKGEPSWTNVSGYLIDNVVDSVGAGDWCTAGIIMTLFKKHNNINSIDSIDINKALKVGQALSALNCTFEGARGLMYNMNRSDLMLLVDYITSQEIKKIPQKSRPVISSQVHSPSLSISSLFAPV